MVFGRHLHGHMLWLLAARGSTALVGAAAGSLRGGMVSHELPPFQRR